MNEQDNRQGNSGERRILEHWQVVAIFLGLYDVIAAGCSYFFALLVRFDFKVSVIDKIYLLSFRNFFPIYALFLLLIFYFVKLYRSVWRFAGYHELVRTVLGNVIAGVFHVVAITFLFCRMPLSYYIGGFIGQLGLTLVIRFSYRVFLVWKSRKTGEDPDGLPLSRVMIIGAGEVGRVIYHEVESNKESGMRVVCFIDDDSNKWGRFVDGIRVVGSRDDILSAAKKYHIDRILIAIGNIDRENRRSLVHICSETGCEVKILPSVLQMTKGVSTFAQMKDVQVEDLLGRDVINVNTGEIFENITGKTVLVTGGGGSISSELCRQIASHSPRKLIIFDIYENNAYDIQNELKRKYRELDLTVLIGSVRDSRRLNSVFMTYRPDIVFHAAAHKHVPLMEDSPCESIKNNVIGTYKTAYAAIRYRVPKFVLISTDKAVNPTNIMGASKRICEMVIQTMGAYEKEGRVSELPVLYTHDGTQDESEVPVTEGRTEFVAVRFGNVLGSNGSVIPLFKKQIKSGGPVTVTHPDIIRYFMTIPEAVSLVLQAGTYAKGGEIFVLDMGEPVKIDTLARNLIKLSGFRPDEDIKIVYTGLRPGEKLYEEKLMGEEGLTTTPNRLIFIGKPVAFDKEKFLKDLRELMEYAYRNDEIVRRLAMDIVRSGGGKV